MTNKLHLRPDDDDRDEPHGLIPAMDSYRHELVQLVRRYGAGLGHRLGCGTYGCVWDIIKSDGRPSGYALKISTDMTEGPATQAVIDTGLDKEIYGLARLDGVWSMPWRASQAVEAWAIVRENIAPFVPLPWVSDYKLVELFPEHQELAFDATREEREWFRSLERYNSWTSRWVEFRREGGEEEDEDEAEYAYESRAKAIGELYRHSETETLGEAIECLEEKGVVLADLHDENIGSRIFDQPGWRAAKPLPGGLPGYPRYPLLAFDFGQTTATSSPGVPTIEEFRRENPGLAAVADAIPAL